MKNFSSSPGRLGKFSGLSASAATPKAKTGGTTLKVRSPKSNVTVRTPKVSLGRITK